MGGSFGSTSGCTTGVNDRDLLFMTMSFVRIKDYWEEMGSHLTKQSKNIFANRLADLIKRD